MKLMPVLKRRLCLLAVGCALLQPAFAHDTTTPSVFDAKTWLQKHAHTVHSSDPAHDDFHDLRAFGEAVGNAQFVSLAQPDHGSGNVFEMKARLVRYLHEKKGFDVLMMESSMFAVQRIWQLAQQGAKVDALAPDNIFFMYSKSAEGRKTLQYIDNQRTSHRPLILSSFSPVGGGANYDREDLLPMLEAYLTAQRAPVLQSPDWANFKTLAKQVVLSFPPSGPFPGNEQIAAFDRVSDQLKTQLCARQADTLRFPQSPGLWCLVNNGVRSTWDSMLGRAYTGEAVAAENFKWLQRHLFPGRKIILWSHYAHLGRGTQSPQSGGANNTGKLLAQAYGKRMYVTAFTSSGGSELAWWNGADTKEVYPVPANTPGSLEAALQELGKPLLFVNARESCLPPAVSNMPAKVSNFTYSPEIDTGLGRAYDGVFYLEQSRPAQINR